MANSRAWANHPAVLILPSYREGKWRVRRIYHEPAAQPVKINPVAGAQAQGGAGERAGAGERTLFLRKITRRKSS
jgi:hypothetical protein